ncbi:MAG: hypothetical protein K8I82_07740, partial [Anaerolineae bacterium]|nr:hypothetical protein [Anaerolineae bacterium]
MLETLIDVWTEELVAGGRIELENFFVLEVKEIDRGMQSGWLTQGGNYRPAPQKITRLAFRASRLLRLRLSRFADDVDDHPRRKSN